MEPQIFNIPAVNLGVLEKLKAKLNKKSAKAGTGEITFTKVSETTEENPDGTVDVIYQIAVEGETPKIAGWTFLARLDHNNDPSGESNFVYVMPGQTLPDEYRTAHADCEHCGWKRRRRNTYILQEDATGNLKQVGHTCVQDFIGVDPAKVVAQAERIVNMIKKARALEEEGTLGVPYNQRHIQLERYLAFVAQSIRIRGWVSGKKAWEEQGLSTANHAANMMFSTFIRDEDLPTDEDNQKAKDALAYAATLDRSQNDYTHNVVTMVNTGYIDWKAQGIAASIVRIYDNHVQKQALQDSQADLSDSDYIGEVGKRINGRVKVIGVKHNVGFYDSTMVRMVSSAGGNLLVTFTAGKFNPKVGDELQIRGTVKKHEEFRGVKQTMLSRVMEVTA